MIIKPDTLRSILKSMIKSENSDNIVNCLISNSSSPLLNLVITLHFNSTKHCCFEKDTYFSIDISNLSKNFIDTKFVEDHLIDIGLLVENKLFGKIIRSDNYSETHDPYNINMKCCLFLGNETLETTCSILDIQKIEKSQIPYFNNGTDLKRLISTEFEGILNPSANDT
jgi:hypothetical protein